MSTLKVNAIQNTSGVEQYLCKAWVNFNGTGTVAIRASGNVSSITDNGVGDYTVNFTVAMSDVNASVLALPKLPSGSASTVAITSNEKTTALSASSTRVLSYTAGGSAVDCDAMNVSVFR